MRMAVATFMNNCGLRFDGESGRKLDVLMGLFKLFLQPETNAKSDDNNSGYKRIHSCEHKAPPRI